ncbi:MAG: hypothetical protein JWP92_2109 [Caulobacter sp.]|nr:hypothetical protein [Caulobacter sp.]
MAFRPCSTRRAVLALLALAASPTLAFANEAKGEGAVDPIFKLEAMGLPVIVDKRLINYVFVVINLTLAPNVSPTIMDDKEPLLRDAVVRMAHRAPFTRPDSYDTLDEARLKAVVLREATTLVGPGKVVGVTLLKQTPKRRLAPPRPPAAAGT